MPSSRFLAFFGLFAAAIALGSLDAEARSLAPKSALRIALRAPLIKGDVPERLAAVFEQVVTTEVRKLDGVAAISAAEIAQMLAFERNRQLMGCDDEATSECMAELANALGAEEVLATAITRLGSSFTVDARRINAQKGTARSATRQVEFRTGEEVLAVVGPLFKELFPDRMLKPGATRGVDKSIARRVNPPPVSRPAFFTAAGATVVAGAAGAVFGLLAADSHAQYLRRAEGARSGDPVRYEELATLREQTQSRAATANALFVATGALAAGTIAAAFLTDWDGDPAPTRARLSVLVGAGTVGVAGTF